MNNYFFVFVGSGLGGCVRYALAQGLSRFAFSFPFATLCANVLAAFVLGVVLNVAFSRLGAETRLLFATGFCGGLSTFSTFSNETLLLAKQNITLAIINITANLILSLSACWIGLKAVEHW